ncbi:MAG: carboxypeptidase-like regulatory domain-containing protein, partial [Candidatus Omnitrophica bacterium]|nr:carboxypeptidase-like regulatory domain-containing protein [Candidatus Omnitrophota bacterium]
MIIKRLSIFLALMILTLIAVPVINCEAKDLIQWKSYVVGLQPPQQSQSPQQSQPPGQGQPPQSGQQLFPEQNLPGANVSIANYPTVKATTDSNGMFVLSGIPSNQLHFFKVTKTGYIPTNMAVKVPDVDIDSTGCFSQTPQSCSFPVKLRAISNEMKAYLDQAAGYAQIDMTNNGMIVLAFFGANDLPLPIQNPEVFVNGDPWLPQFYFVLGPQLILFNVPPGETRIEIKNVPNVTIPLITLPVFVGEITIFNVNIVNQSQMGTVTGKVENVNNNNPISGAIVEAIPEGMQGRYETTTTDANGNYTLNLIQGVYKISAKAQGYARQFYYFVDNPQSATKF